MTDPARPQFNIDNVPPDIREKLLAFFESPEGKAAIEAQQQRLRDLDDLPRHPGEIAQDPIDDRPVVDDLGEAELVEITDRACEVVLGGIWDKPTDGGQAIVGVDPGEPEEDRTAFHVPGGHGGGKTEALRRLAEQLDAAPVDANTIPGPSSDPTSAPTPPDDGVPIVDDVRLIVSQGQQEIDPETGVVNSLVRVTIAVHGQAQFVIDCHRLDFQGVDPRRMLPRPT